MSQDQTDIFNLKFARQQTLNNDELLKTLLRQFLDDNKDIIQEIRQLSPDNIHDLHFQLHRLKGVSSNLGLESLHMSCQELCDSLLDNNPMTDNQFKQLEAATIEAFDCLEHFLNDSSSGKKATTSVCDSSIREIFNSVMTKVCNQEFISDAEMKSLHDALTDKIDENTLSGLKDALSHFEYDVAHRHLCDIEKQLP